MDYILQKPKPITTSTHTEKILMDKNPMLFHRTIGGSTPVYSLETLAKEMGIGDLYVKDESHRFGLNAFKVLGASWAIEVLLKKNPGIETFYTATDGNHGRAVAWAAARNGRKSVIYVPAGTAEARKRAIGAEGGKVFEANGDYDYAVKVALEASSKKGGMLVQDTAWEGYEEVPLLIMSGYMTIFREISLWLAEKNASADVIFLQAGVGSFAASAVWFFRKILKSDKVKIVVVEPANSDGLYRSVIKGMPVAPDQSDGTIMAGLSCGVPSIIAWQILKNGVDAFLRIPDQSSIEAMKKLRHPAGGDPSVVSGESGAAGLGGLLDVMTNPDFNKIREHLSINESTRCLLINTEGDTDPVSYNEHTAK